MKILYDFQTFTIQKYGGISRYFYELFSYYYKTKILEPMIIIKHSENENLKKLDFIKLESYKDLSTFLSESNILKRYFYKILIKFHSYNYPSMYEKNRQNIIKILKNKDYDLFHPTYYDTYFIPYLNNTPFVLTVHDMIHEVFKDLFKELNDLSFIKKKKELILKANKIIAVSENTKNDIIKLYNIPSEKIEVIYHGNSLDTNFNSYKIKDNFEINLRLYTFLKNYLPLPDKYILYVGNRTIYKNFNFFLYSIYPLFKEDSQLYLILAGGQSLNENEINLINRLNIREKIIRFDIDDLILSYLYSNALCFVFPSLYEGFGLPILEAFSCNCPVVCSNTSSLPEVANNAAIYFDPKDQEDILIKIKTVIENRDLRRDLIEKGKQRLSFFSWENCAKKTFEVYKKVLEK